MIERKLDLNLLFFQFRNLIEIIFLLNRKIRFILKKNYLKNLIYLKDKLKQKPLTTFTSGLYLCDIRHIKS